MFMVVGNQKLGRYFKLMFGPTLLSNQNTSVLFLLFLCVVWLGGKGIAYC